MIQKCDHANVLILVILPGQPDSSHGPVQDVSCSQECNTAMLPDIKPIFTAFKATHVFIQSSFQGAQLCFCLIF